MADVKLLASQRLTDNPDGGGLMTSNEIVDNVVNNIWPDVSRVDRAFGVVNLRKLYVKADTADSAIYSGLHCICLFPPQDPRIAVTMFSTNSWSDERADAQSSMERYLDESVPTPMIPFDRQLSGQRTILVFQRPEIDLPQIGEVYVIANLPDEDTVQFFRITDLDHAVQTFTDTIGDFKARVITITISEPLQSTFQGSLPTRFFVASANTSKTRKTIVSDAVNYHTVHALAADAAIDDLTIKLDSVYAQLVPASTRESSILGDSPSQSLTVVQSGLSSVTLTIGTGHAPAVGESIYFSVGMLPGTVHVDRDGNVWNRHDDGGLIVDVAETQFATIEYADGSITVTSAGSSWSNNSVVISALPSAAVSLASQTLNQPISQSTRGYVYNATLHPTPAPGTLQIRYRALGKWYTLTDDGSGKLTGDVGIGSGLLNFATSIASVSLGALPDIGSSIIYAWGGDSQFEIKTGDVTIDKPVVNGTLPLGNCKPSTFSVSWTAGTISKTATDDGAGNLTGDATGRIVYGDGTFSIKPTLLHDPTTTFNISYQASTIHTELFNPSKSGSTITMTVAHPTVREKSILVTYQQTIATNFGSITTTQQLADDGSGNLIDAAGDIKAGSVADYTTGAIEFNPDFTTISPTLDYNSFENQIPARIADPGTGYFSAIAAFGNWPSGATEILSPISFVNGTNVTIQYKEDSASDTSHTYSIAAPPLTVDLTPTTFNTVVPGGVMFTLGGRTYIDRAGSLYYGVSPTTNAATLGGALDYSSGLATVTSWVGGASATISLQALLTQVGALPSVITTGLVSGSPLRPGSFYIQANQLDGTLISATADNDGNLSTSSIHGYIDATTGVFSIAWGQYVLDSSLTSDDKAEPWYDSGNVGTDGYIFRPKPVIGSSITFNCVVQTSLPLDSTILGIDPVRLPLDGRVQAVRPGNMIIFHDTAVQTMSGGLTAGHVTTLTRGSLALIEVRDQTGAFVGSVSPGVTTGAYFTADLSAGTITMATPLDLSAFTQPLVATHRIEDSSLVTDVQITGHVSIVEPLTHAYTAANSLASTALIAPFVGGSVQGKYTHLFSQQTWNSSSPNWTDAIIGSPTTPQYDDLDWPIIVLNRDAITEKWALVFTSSTAFQIVAQDLGVIGTGNTSTDVQPNNPGTSHPYFFLDHRGFGSGWATGNVIRFDTEGAGMQAWLARTIKSGPASYTDDRDVIEPRWDKS